MGPRIQRWLINTFIVMLLAAMLVDALPQSPVSVRMAIRPLLIATGLEQGPWQLFAPDPGETIFRLRAEITYRDGKQVAWSFPHWRHESAWNVWWQFRRRQFLHRLCLQEAAPAWPTWGRHLARTLRPDLADADRGAEVRLIFQEARIPPPDNVPWPSWREPIEYEDVSVLPLERF